MYIATKYKNINSFTYIAYDLVFDTIKSNNIKINICIKFY